MRQRGCVVLSGNVNVSQRPSFHVVRWHFDIFPFSPPPPPPPPRCLLAHLAALFSARLTFPPLPSPPPPGTLQTPLFAGCIIHIRPTMLERALLLRFPLPTRTHNM